MSPKQRFNLMLEPWQVVVLRAIEERTGAPMSEQIRRALDAYFDTQTVITKTELRKLVKG